MLWDAQDIHALLWLLDNGWVPWLRGELINGVVYVPEGW